MRHEWNQRKASTRRKTEDESGRVDQRFDSCLVGEMRLRTTGLRTLDPTKPHRMRSMVDGCLMLKSLQLANELIARLAS